MGFTIEKISKVLEVSRSVYYEYKRFIESPRHKENCSLLLIIKQINQKSKARYGSPRITAELSAMGYKVSHGRVWPV